MAESFKEEPSPTCWEELLVELDLEVVEGVEPAVWQALEPRSLPGCATVC
jgi:hypothetical protein